MKVKTTLHLMEQTTEIDSAIRKIILELNEILSDNRRQLTLDYKWMRFKSEEAATDADEKRLSRQKMKIIKKIVTDCVKKSVRDAYSKTDEDHILYAGPWEPLKMFYNLSDPDDYRCEKIDVKDVHAIGDSEYGSRRPLNKESYHVKQELIPDEDMELFPLDEEGNTRPMIWKDDKWIIQERVL